MNDSPKIHIDDLQVRVSPAEINSIFGLTHRLNFFEQIGKYVSSYLEQGWEIKLIIPQLDIVLDVDFRQEGEVWIQKLTALGLKGIQTSLVVYTGPVSNLLVLEVRGNNSEKAFMLGRDWRSKCVIQVDSHIEQHFFTWPGSLNLSKTKNLANLDLTIFGEGGKIILPPSLIPDAEESIHWLIAPWESQPGPPTPRLMEFLESHFPQEDENPDLPAFEEILSQIASQERLLQALLTPTADAAGYYQRLLKEARAAGIQDQRLILGLLWHAPLGTARHEVKSLPWLKELMQEDPQEDISGILQIQNQLADLVNEFSKMMKGIDKERKDTLKNSFTNFNPSPGTPVALKTGENSRVGFPQNPDSEAGSDKTIGAIRTMAANMENVSVNLVHPAPYPQGEIPVNRNKYEAMIYELGRLQTLEKTTTQLSRETKVLKAKLESQRQEEITYLRQMALEKKLKKLR